MLIILFLTYYIPLTSARAALSTAYQDEQLMRREQEVPRNTLYINDPRGVLVTTPATAWTDLLESAASNVDVTAVKGTGAKGVLSYEGAPVACPDTYSAVYHTTLNCYLPGMEAAEVTPSEETPTALTGQGSDIHETVNNHDRELKTAGLRVLVGEGNGLTYLDLENPQNTLVLNYTDLKAYGVDSHRPSGVIFIAGAKKIISTQKDHPVVVSSGVEDAVRLAVDWVEDKLYWVSDSHVTVEAANLDGSNRTTLGGVRLSFVYPNNIAVDPHNRLLFLVGNHSVYWSDLLGANLTRLYGDRRVKCLAVDEVTRTLYLSGRDSTGSTFLSFGDYDGHGLYDLPSGHEWEDVFGLDVHAGTLYLAVVSGGRDSLWSWDIQRSAGPVKRYEASPGRQGIWSVKVLKPEVEKQARV